MVMLDVLGIRPLVGVVLRRFEFLFFSVSRKFDGILYNRLTNDRVGHLRFLWFHFWKLVILYIGTLQAQIQFLLLLNRPLSL